MRRLKVRGALAFALLLGAHVAMAGNPKTAVKLRDRARIALERKDYTEAADLLEKAYAEDPSKPAVLKDLAVVLASAGKIEESVARYREYLKLVPTDDAAALAMATTFTWGKEKAQIAEGEKLLTEYLAKHPDADDALLQRARARSWTGQSEAAEADFRAYLAKHPNEEKVKLELALALSARKDPKAFAAAIAIYDAHLAAEPRDMDVVLQRARVHSWLGHTSEAVSDYRAYSKTKPDDEAATVELGRTLAQSKRPEDVAEAIAIFDRRLASHPEDADVLLERARARAWSGQKPQAIADYRAYVTMKPADQVAASELAALDVAALPTPVQTLANLRAYAAQHPEDDQAKLDIASFLSGNKDRAALLEALTIYDAHLTKHPADAGIRLRRARVRGWAGMTKEAVEDFRVYEQTHPSDDALLLEIANVLALGSDPSLAIPLYDAYLVRHPSEVEPRMRRARALLWAGIYAKAEAALKELRAEAKTDEEKTPLDLDLARLYSQTGRRADAMELLDEVIERSPKDAAARAEHARLAIYFGTRVEPRIFYYTDKIGIKVGSIGAEARVMLNRKLAVIADVSAWSVGNKAETIAAGRANLGGYARLRSFEVEAAAGPRLYQFYPASYGARGLARVTPTPWLNSTLTYQYDDIYFDMLQPASISAGIRGHAVYLAAEGTFPFMRVTGRAGSRFLLPTNVSKEATANVQFPIVRPLSVGYNVQYLSWTYTDPSYWSPQAFAAHQLVVRLAQGFQSIGVSYDVQAVGGIAGERIQGTPEAGFGPSFGGSGTISYSPTPRVELRIGGQYSQTVREIPPPAPLGSAPPTPVKQGDSLSRYWWIIGTASATLYL
jgi:tetratricopeptide (TPR) repeat protein